MKKLLQGLIFFLLVPITINAQWVNQTSGTTNTLYGVSFTDINNGTVVGGDGIILRTTDGGQNWVSQQSGTTFRLYGVSFTDADNGTAVGIATILRTTDGGQNWFFQTSGITDILLGVSFTDENNGTIVGQDGKIYRTTNGGNNWLVQTSGTTNWLWGVSFTDANNGTAVGQYGIILKTINGGQNWIKQDSGSTSYFYGISFTDANNGTVVGEEGTILRTTDGGQNWVTQSSGTTKTLYGVSFTDADNGTVVGQYGMILRTTDGGQNWVIQTSGTTDLLLGVSFSYTNDGTAVGASGTILRYTNGTKTPVIFIPGIMASALFDDTNDDNHLYRNSSSYNTDEFIWFDRQQILKDRGDSFLDVLQLDENGIDPLSSNYKIKVAPLKNDDSTTVYDLLNYEPISYYKKLLMELQNNENGYKLDNFNYDHSEGENLYLFTYDWRKSNSHSEEVLSTLIDSILIWNNTDKVNIIAHSMGGLLAKKYVSIYGTQKIKKIIFIGTPHQGAPKILFVMPTGKLLGPLGWITKNKEIRKISRNMPSVYELMPSVLYSNVFYNNGYTTTGLLLYLNYFRLPGIGEATYDQTLDFFKTTTLNEGFTFNTTLIDNADIFRSSIENINLNGVESYNIVGFNVRTIGKVNVRKIFGSFYFYDKWNLSGDGTVPLRSAEIVNYDKVRADYYIKNIEHLDLPSSDPVIEILTGLLKEPAVISGFPSDSTFIFYEPPETYAARSLWQTWVGSPVELHAYDFLGNHTGPLTDTTWEAGIPNSNYIPGDLRDPNSTKMILLPHEIDFRVKIISQDTTSYFDFTLDELINGYNPRTIYFDSVAIQPNTIATSSVTTVTTEFLLEVDYDGDGIIDTTIYPTLITDVEEGNNSNVIITDYSLSQNYPNPFNPTTTIKYQIPELLFVSLKIYDVLGNEIATLVNEEKPAGSYEVDFDGGEFTSGVYFYRMQAGEFVDIKKFVLLK